MQERLTAAVAVVATTCILLAHLISLRHETTVAHVRDSVGVLEHAHALAEYHAISTVQHLHGNGDQSHSDVGACSLLAGLEQSTVLAHAPTLVAVVAPSELTGARPPARAERGTEVLAFAPKTSPPAA